MAGGGGYGDDGGAPGGLAADQRFASALAREAQAHLLPEEDAIDPDSMSYEQLLALDDAVGLVSRGVKKEGLQKLSSSDWKAEVERAEAEGALLSSGGAAGEGAPPSPQLDVDPKCVICQYDFCEGELVCTLPCKHKFHTECVEQWLQVRNECPFCKHEIARE